MSRGFFITGTDTDVGKTVVTALLGLTLQDEGLDVGVMKPVQCSGEDAQFLKDTLSVEDDLDLINPFYLDEPLSPHIAFQRAKRKFDRNKVFESYQRLSDSHDVVLVEGAGGVMVPIEENYLMLNLMKDMRLAVIVVARAGLGTINHTLLTVEQLCLSGLDVLGVILNQTTQESGIAEETNPDAIEKYGDVKVLGQVPWMESVDQVSLKNIAKTFAGQSPDANLFSNIFSDQQPATSNQQLMFDDKQYIWHPFTQMKDWIQEDYHLVIDRADGNYLYDTDGNQYLDAVSSLWVTVHGHNHPVINRHIQKQLNTLDHSTLLGLANKPSIELAKKLVEITPEGLDKVFYSDSGSTSVEIAIKMAYQYWQNIGRTHKTKIAHLANSYHGDTLGSVSIGGIDLFHQVYRDMIFETIKIDFPDCYRCPEDKSYPGYAFEYVDRFEKLLKDDADQIAAFVVEPLVQGAAGMIMWPEGILKRFEQLCKEYNVIFICDEVATGFGRTGTMFACEQEDVTPDIMCLAKGITGGYLPLAATVVSQKIYDGFVFDYHEMKTFFHGHTYTGNPLACAAALGSLEVFEKEDVIENLQPKIKSLSERLQMFYNHPFVGRVSQKGLMAGIELVESRETKKPFEWKKKIGVQVCQKAREKGVILRPLGNVIVLMPPLSITNNEINRLLEVTHWAMKEVLE